MKKRLYLIIISAILYIIALTLKFENKWITNSIFIISYIIVGHKIVKKALKNIFRGKVFDENFLMSLATIGAFAIGEFPEAVAVMLFYQLGELFQDFSVDKSKKSIKALMNIRPDYANVNRDSNIIKVKPEDVKIGEIITIKPGERVPLDGIVIEGTTMLDTSAITGESVPRKINVNDKIQSGCINKNGVIKVKVTKIFGQSTVSKILDLVENASSKKSKSEKFITKFAKYYTPTVVIIALLLAIFPPIILKESFTTWLYRALSFLVVSCPCALVISIPLGFFGGIGAASQIGVLIKGSNYLEALSNINTIIFDKTGTLTEGVFEVIDISPINITKEQLIDLVYLAEYYSNHPVAESIKRISNKEVDKSRIGSIKEIEGQGIKAIIDGQELLVGNDKLMLENKIKYKKCKKVGTLLYVSLDKKYVGYILISDKIKKDSPSAIESLRKLDIRNIIMLTGDKKEVGEYVGNQLGIDEVHTELLPDGKVKEMEKIMAQKEKNTKVAFVGDGINDAPTLALSDIGIAMGGLGSDAAIEAADIVIMTDEPSKIAKSINISKKTMKIVKENIIFAIFVKIVVLLLSALGVATMWEAVFADVGVSILAILNSLRMLIIKKD